MRKKLYKGRKRDPKEIALLEKLRAMAIKEFEAAKRRKSGRGK